MTRDGFEERQEARRARLLERAKRAENEAEAATAAANKVAGAIPMGQPILVGHHSEKRHRRDLQRIDDGYRKASEKRKEAERLRRQAEGVGTAGISSDDPDAKELLEQKLRALVTQQEKRKAVNAAWRKAGKPDPKTSDGWEPVALALGVSVEAIREIRLNLALLRTHQPSASPFPAYVFANGNAEVRRLKARLTELEVAAARVPRSEEQGVCRVVEDPDDNRIRLIFPGKPEERVRELLKRRGFRWSATASAWQRHLNAAGRVAAQGVVDALRKEGHHDEC